MVKVKLLSINRKVFLKMSGTQLSRSFEKTSQPVEKRRSISFIFLFLSQTVSRLLLLARIVCQFASPMIFQQNGGVTDRGSSKITNRSTKLSQLFLKLFAHF